MDAIEQIREKLTKYPQLTFTVGDNWIAVDPPTDSGFTVSLKIQRPEWYTVGYDSWHEEFDDEAKALDCFAYGFSDQCRLKVTLRGQWEYKWSLEYRKGDTWVEDSTTGLFLFPFWKKRRIEYRQNSVIRTNEPGFQSDDD